MLQYAARAIIIKRLNKLAKDAKEVLIATDPDREGEAIAWHIAEEVKKKNNNVKRVLFNEITKDGVKRGLANPMEINESVFMSQQGSQSHGPTHWLIRFLPSFLVPCSLIHQKLCLLAEFSQ
jgi:DNA topoisomerase IA